MSRSRAPVLAWVLCGVLATSVLLQMAAALANPGPSDSVVVVPEDLLLGLTLVAIGVVAALIVSRQPRNVIGWLLMCPALISAIPADTYIHGFATAPAHPSPLLYLALWFSSWSWLLLIFPTLFILVLFPTGRPPGRRWGWLILGGLGMCAFFLLFAVFSAELGPVSGEFEGAWTIPNPIGVFPEEAFPMVAWTVLLGVLTVGCAASVIVRYRSADYVERTQMKWVLYAFAAFAVVYLSMLGRGGLERSAPIDLILRVLFPVSILVIPLAIAVAILRYRLWDIEVIIHRTLVYGALTGALALVYLAGVALSQSLLQSLTDQGGQLAIVATTLGIAALFNPLRRLIQAVIDRRFYRRKYDAARALAVFSGTVQEQVSLEDVSQALLSVVTDTVQPAETAIWLREPKEDR